MDVKCALAPIGLLILALIVLGVIVAAVSLLSHERTRAFFKAVLAVLGVMLGLGLLASLFIVPYVALRREAEVAQQHAEVVQQRAEERARELLDEAAPLEPSRARPPGPVFGTVQFDGQPIPEGTISFLPIEGTEGPWHYAKIVRGRYAFPQVPAGTYRVAIRATRPAEETVQGPDGTEIPAEEQYLPSKYNVESELRASVEPGMNTFDFELAADAEPDGPAPKSTDAVAVAEGHEPDEPEARQPTDPSENQPPAPAPRSPETTAQQEPAPPDDRPEWVDWEPGELHKVGSACQMAISVGPYSSRLECDQKLPDELHAAMRKYTAARVGPAASARVRLPLEYLRSHVIRTEWEEQTQVLITPRGQIPEKYVRMTQLHVLLQFDHQVNTLIEQEWDNVVARERIAVAGVSTAVVLLLLGLVYAWLKIDLSTGGRYRGRLRLAAAALLVVMVVAGFALMLVGWRMSRPPHVDVHTIQLGTATPIEEGRGDVAWGPDFQPVPAHSDGASVPAPPPPPARIEPPPAAVAPAETVYAPREARGPLAAWAIIMPIGALLLLGGIATLSIAFKKTRLIGLVLLPVVILGALILLHLTA
jgi:hypothetical protein